MERLKGILLSVAVKYTPVRGRLSHLHQRLIAHLNASRQATKNIPDMAALGFSYYWIEGAEELEGYLSGGYHPVLVGDVLNNRYQVIDKLGFGGYSTVWVAQDLHRRQYVAVKVCISQEKLPRTESAIFRRLRESMGGFANDQHPVKLQTAIPNVLDEFEVIGPNGIHPCHVTLPAQGSLDQAQACGGLSLFHTSIARALAARLVMIVAWLHSQNIVHGDINTHNTLIGFSHKSRLDALSLDEFREKYEPPATVLIRRFDGTPLPESIPHSATLLAYLGKKASEFTIEDVNELMLSDFGEAWETSAYSKLGKDYHSALVYKPPEAHFEPMSPLTSSADVWSLALAIWDILGVRPLFSQDYDPNEVVAEQIDTLGYDDFPLEWKRKWERDVETPTDGNDFKHMPRKPQEEERELWPSLEDAFHECNQEIRLERPAHGVFEQEEIDAILSLLRQMLRFAPETRLSVHEVLESDWMVRWALPALKGTDVGEVKLQKT